MPFIKPLCPSVAFERPEVKGLRAFGFRSFYKCGTQSLIGPIGIDIQLFNPIPVQNQHTGNCIVDFSHPYLGKWHDGSHKVPLHLLIEMHKRGNRRHRRMARAQENFCGSPIVRLFGPPNPGHTFNSHSRRSTTCAEHAQPVVSEGGLEPPRPCGHQPLKLARLPIPPLRRGASGRPGADDRLPAPVGGGHRPHTQSSVLATASAQRASRASRSPSGSVGSQRPPSCQLARRSSRPSQ